MSTLNRQKLTLSQDEVEDNLSLFSFKLSDISLSDIDISFKYSLNESDIDYYFFYDYPQTEIKTEKKIGFAARVKKTIKKLIHRPAFRRYGRF